MADGLLLTATHVLGRPAGASIEVEFVASSPGRLFPVEAVPPARPDLRAADIAVLELREDAARMSPLEMWAPARPPAQVDVLGFPIAEDEATGVWRTFDVAGPTSRGDAIQLRWREDVGSLPGQSGGPVLDAEKGVLAGVVVEGADRGRFDRYVPVGVAQERWPQLPRPWMIVGTDARDHFARRAAGRRDARAGTDLFSGRVAALEAARRWMLDPEPPGLPLVITGQPGAGKSSVLARTALHELEAERYGPGLAVNARDATVEEVLEWVGALVGAPSHATLRDLLAALDAEASTPDDNRPWLIAVDGVDESSAERMEIARTLAQIAGHPAVRMLVATRRRAPANAAGLEIGVDDDRYPSSSLLTTLGAAAGSVIDLDVRPFSDPAGLSEFVEKLLREPGGRGRAWEEYRDDRRLRRRLAREITGRSDGNYLVAALATEPMRTRPSRVDPAAPDFDPASIPASVGEAVQTFLRSLPDEQQPLWSGALTALAYARGEGLDDSLWCRFAAALDYPITRSNLDALRTSPAVDYLVQSTWAATGRRVSRLFHQALVDQLLDDPDRPRDRRGDHAALARLLRELVTSDDPVEATYAGLYLADHAAPGDLLPAVLTDPDFLLHADLGRLRVFMSRPDVRSTPEAALLRRVAVRADDLDVADRAFLFALAAAHLARPELHRRYAERCTSVRPLWAQPFGDDHQELTDDAGPVTDLAVAYLPDGHAVLAASGRDGAIRLWNPATGTLRHTLLGHTGWVTELAVGELVDGRTVLASADTGDTTSDPGKVCLWDLESGALRHRLGDELTSISGLALARLPDGRAVVAACGELDEDGVVLVWEVDTGALRHVLSGHAGWATALLSAPRSDGHVVLASGDRNGTVRVWDPDTGALWHELADETDHEAPVSTFAAGRLADGRPFLAAGRFGDPRVRVWDLDTGALLNSLLGRGNRVEALLGIRPTAGRSLLAVGDDGSDWAEETKGIDDDGARSSGRIGLWDLERGALDHTLTGQTGPVSALAAVGLPDGHTAIAGAGRGDRYDAGTIRLWNSGTGTPEAVLAGHTGEVTALTVAHLRTGGQVLASAGNDGTIRLWGLETIEGTRAEVADPGWFTALALAHTDDGRLLLASARSAGDDANADDVTVELRDPSSGGVQRTLNSHTGTIRRLTYVALGDGELLLAGGDVNGTVRLWDPDTGSLRHTLTGHTSPVTALAVAHLSSGETVLVSADGAARMRDRHRHRGTVRLWDPETGTLRHSLSGHVGSVTEMAVVPLRDGRSVLATAEESRGDRSNVLQLWDVDTGALRHTLADHDNPVQSLAVARLPDGGAVLASAGSSSGDPAVRLWDPDTGLLRDTLSGFSGNITALAAAHLADGRAVLASASTDLGHDNATLRLWDPETGALKGTLAGHTGLITGLAVAHLPDGRPLFVTASGGSDWGVDDRTVRLWDPESGAPWAVLRTFAVANLIAVDGAHIAVVAAGRAACFVELGP